jgi:hypothetical protein
MKKMNENNFYETIKKNGYYAMDSICLELCLQILIKIGDITDDQRIEFLKSIKEGEPYNSVMEKFQLLINNKGDKNEFII